MSDLKIWKFSLWDIKTIRDFDSLLVSLDSTPSSKVLLSSMIKYSEMYNPVRAGTFQFNRLDLLEGINAERRGKRAQAYLHEKDLIKTTTKEGVKQIFLTSRGHKIFYESYPLARLRKEKWNGNWVVVTYDLPQKLKLSRDYFRKKLKRLGFGSPQESLLVTPLPLEKAVNDLVNGEKLAGYVWVLTAKRVLGMENSEIASRAWNLGEINGLYAKLLEIFPRINKHKNKMLKAEWRRLFLALDLADPYLPLELLPPDWLGEKCRKQFYTGDFRGLMTSFFSSLLSFPKS